MSRALATIPLQSCAVKNAFLHSEPITTLPDHPSIWKAGIEKVAVVGCSHYSPTGGAQSQNNDSLKNNQSADASYIKNKEIRVKKERPVTKDYHLLL